MKRLCQLWGAVAIVSLCFNPTSANAVLISNFEFSVSRTSVVHGESVTATVSFYFVRQYWVPGDWGPIAYSIRLLEADPIGDDEIRSKVGYISGEPQLHFNREIHVLENFNFTPHDVGEMHRWFEGDEIELYVVIEDLRPNDPNFAHFDRFTSRTIKVRCTPEPSTLFLLVSGMACLVGFGRKRLFK